MSGGQSFIAFEGSPDQGKDVLFDYPKFGYIAKTKVQAREIIWNYFSKYLSSFPDAYLDAHRMRVVIPRSKHRDHVTVVLKAARNYDDVRGEKFWEMMADEFQDHPLGARAVLYSTLTDLKGKFYFSGTAKGMKNNLYELVCKIIDPKQSEQGKVWMFPVDATNVFDAETLKTIMGNMSDEEFRREYLLDFTVGYGKTFYGELVEKFINKPEHIGSYDPSLPLVLAADIGVGDALAAWLLQVNSRRMITLLDYYEGHELLGDLRADIGSDWEDRYVDMLILPHDQSRRLLSVYKVTKQRDVFRQAFPEAELVVVKKTTSKAADIVSVKENFHLLHYQDQTKKVTDIRNGLTHLTQYGPKTNEDGVVIGAEDRRTGSGHCADALRYAFRGLGVKGGVVWRGVNRRRDGRQEKVRMPSWSRGQRFSHPALGLYREEGGHGRSI